jgi:Flp pilus assembly protein protease CpaA
VSDTALAIGFLVLSVMFPMIVVRALGTGEIPLPTVPTVWVNRSEQPYMFWVFVACHAAMFTMFIVLGIRWLQGGM